ncbi:hypothetical protein ACOQFL_16775 [Actinopolyspora sp. H202]|uniref:WXG100-like domain-containing protein n=1 Tax=Actinopolyspora sp. H202 TaxID=1500456 RepID=UPI003EE6B81D
MPTELPEGLQKALEIVGGQRWPEGDEDGLRRMSVAWSDISAAIDRLEAAVDRSANDIGTTMHGEFSDAYGKYVTDTLRPMLQELREKTTKHSELAKNTAADIQYVKISIIVQLVIVAATLAFSWLPGIGQAITAAAAATARAVITSLFRTVLQNIIVGAAAGAALEVGLDAVIQGMQMLTGVRTDWNEDFTKGAAVGGALGGAMGGAMGGLVHGVGKFTKGGIDKTIDEGKIVRGPAAESADGILGQGAKNFLDTTGGKLAFDVGNVAGQGVGGFTADGATNAALGQEEWNPFSFTSSMVDGLEGRGDRSADDGSDTDALGGLKSFGGGDLPDAALPQTTSSPDGTYAEDTPDGGIRTEWSGQDGGNTATPGLPDKQNVPVAPAEDGPVSGTNQSTGTDVPMVSTGQNSTPPSNTNDSDVTVDGAPPNGTDRNGDPGATTPTPEIKSIAGYNTTGWNNTGRNGDWSPDNVERSPVDTDVADSGVDGSVPETPTFTPEINAVSDNGIDGRIGVTQEPGSFGGTTPASSDTTGTVTSNSSGDTPTILASAPPPAETTESAPEHTNTDAVPDNVERSPVDTDVADSGVDGSVPETPTFTPEINAVSDNGIDGRIGVTQEPGSFGGTTPASSDTTGTVTSNSSGDTPTILASAPPPAETTESAPEHTNTDAVRDHDDSSSFTPHPMDEGSMRGDGEETTSAPRQHGTFGGPAPQTSTPDHSGGAGTGNAPVPDIATHQADPTPESTGPAQLSQDTSTGPSTWSDDAAPRTDTDTPPTEQVNGPRFDGNTASAGTDSDTANTGAPPIAPVSVGQGTNGTPGTSGTQGTPPSTTGRATSTDGGPNTSTTKQPSGSAPSTTGKPSRGDTESAPHNAPTRPNRGAGPATTSRDTPSTPPSRQPAPSTGEHTTTRAGRTTDPNAGSAAGRTTDPNAGSAAEHTPDTHPPHPDDLHSESSAPSQPHETAGQPGPTPELGRNQHHQAGPTIHHHNGIQSTPLTELHGYHGVKPDHYNAVLNQIQRPTTGTAGNEDSDWKGWYLGEKPDHAANYALNDDGHSGAVLDFELPHHVTVHTIPPELSANTDALKATLKRHFGIDDDTPLLDGLADQNSVLRISENSDGDHELIVPWLLAQNGTARHNDYVTDMGKITSNKPRGWDRWVPTNHTDSSAPRPEGSAAHEQDPATSDTQRPQAHHSRITSPAEWGDRRDTAIATHHRSERFDPAANPLIDKGLVQGAVTRIDYDVRRFEVAPDNWVREFTVKLDLVSPNDAVSPQARQELGERVRSHIDEHINQRHRLPTSDDQLHVNLEFDTAKWDDAPAGHPVVKVHDSTGVDRGDSPKQLTWDTTHPSGPLVHEVMHFLGLGEGYRDPDLLLRHPDRPGVMGAGAWDAHPTLTQDDLHTLEDIADSGPVIRDHPLTEPGPSAHGETGTGQRHDLPDSQVPANTPDDPTPGPGDPYGESSAPRRPTDLPPVPEEFELETLQRWPENGERNPADPAAEHTTNGDAAHQQEPRSFTDEVLAEFDRRMHDRSEQPKVIGEPDGKSVRETASELLGSHEGSRDEQVEDFVRIALSDENLQKNFHRMLDGGYVMDFGSRPGHRATEVTVELADLGEPRNEGVHKDNMDFENEQKRERNSSTARGALGTLSFGGRVPILNFLGQVQVKGLVNSRESGMSTETSHSTKTKLTEEDVARNSTEHDAKYKITVRTRDGRLGDETVSRSDSANGHVKLAWGQRDTANAKSEVNMRDISTDSIRHAQFSGLDNVYRKVADELGLKKNDPGGRELNEWLQSLGKDVLAGPVRETFTFNNSSRPTEIVLGVDKDVQAHRLPDVGGTAEHTTTNTAKRTTTQANTRDRGVDAVVGGGDITGANGALAGLNVAHSRSTRNESSTTDEHESRSVETHKGPFTKHQLDLKYLAQVTTRSEPGKLLTADGSATLWSSQHRADPAPDPGSTPAGVDRHRFPDHIDAQHRIPDETVQGITGPVLIKLRLEGLLPDDELPRIRTKFDDFVREHARDLTSGDGIRFPLSALHSGAPDVFVRGNLNRADAKYLGSPRERTLGGAVGSTHENVGERVHSKDTSVGALATAALTIPGSPPPSQYNHYPEAYAKRNFSRGSAEKSTQQAGYERSLDSTRKIHQFRYPTEFEVRIGGRWSDRPGIAEWRGPNDDESTHTLSGDVEVAAPEKSGKRFDGPAPEQPQEHSGWNKDDPPGPLERTGHLPAGFELESLKPVPGLLTTITEMLNAAPETKQRRWSAVPFVGNKPVSFDEHRGSDIFRPRDKHHNALDEHNTALDAVEAFASTDFRTAQFELTALHRDTGQFRSHNTGSLFGNRELSAQVDLSTRLGTPRIVSREDDHGFEGTKEHTSTELGSEERKNTNYETGVDASQYITTSPTTMAGPTATASAKYTDSDTVSGNSASAKNTSSSSRSERGYLVRFDARHEVRTSVQHTTQNYLRLLHHGDVAEETRWVDVPGAVEVWVPASEIHQIGELTSPEIEKLDSADADRYHQQNRVPGASDVPEAPDTSDASDAPSGQRTGSQPVARSEEDPADSTLRPPQNVGRGSGRVELHRLGAGKELVEGIEQRLDQWSRENGRPKTSAKLTDIAREALGKPVPDRQPKVEKFDAINDRLVRDVLGPTVSRHGFNTALGEMLNGGRPMYLEGSTAFGKVEQLVVLRARTGDGQYYQSLSKHATTDSHETKTHDKRGHHKGWDIDGGLGGANYAGIGNPVASLQRVGLTGGYTDKHGSEFTNESSNTVATKTGNATSDGPESTDTGANKPDTTGTSHSPGRGVQFLHDLTIDMEVYPYARPGTYSTPLAKLTPALAPRRFGEPFKASFSLPDATRSTVDIRETISTDGSASDPVEAVSGSLRQRQSAQRVELGWPENTNIQARPFPAPGLHEKLDELVHGDSNTESPPRPVLNPSPAFRLHAATTVHQLRSHLREATSKNGYSISLASGSLDKVRITADLTSRELIRTIDEGELSRSTTDKQELTPDAQREGRIGITTSVDFREPSIQEAPMRSNQGVIATSQSATPWNGETKHTITSTKENPDNKTDGARYLVRVTPEWTITPTYRAKKAPPEWGQPLRTGPDEPIMLEVDRDGLELLGLHDPPPERAPIEEDPPPESDPIEDDWPVYARELLDTEQQSSGTALADFLAPTRAPQHAEADGGKRPDQ